MLGAGCGAYSPRKLESKMGGGRVVSQVSIEIWVLGGNTSRNIRCLTALKVDVSNQKRKEGSARRPEMKGISWGTGEPQMKNLSRLWL